ncbi:MAG: hypothetical protein N2255_00990 [Kiritimatiellae bacterium]|nr:hypothetical protein [Kiritimatiellia bacterium]
MLLLGLMGLGQGVHERGPREGQVVADAVAVLGDATRPADAAEDAFAAGGTDGMRDGPLAAEGRQISCGAG